MSLLVLALLAGVEVDGAGAYVGLHHGVGGFVRATATKAAWGDERHGGQLDLGLQVGYDFQSYALAGWLGPDEKLTGGEHRAHLWVVAGHTAHRSRFSLGVHVLAGLTHHVLEGAFSNAPEGVSGSFATHHDLFAFGLGAKLGCRVGEQWGVALYAAGFPLASTWSGTGYFSGALGVFVQL